MALDLENEVNDGGNPNWPPGRAADISCKTEQDEVNRRWRARLDEAQITIRPRGHNQEGSAMMEGIGSAARMTVAGTMPDANRSLGAAGSVPALTSLILQINGRIDTIQGRQEAIGSAIGRLINPRPSEVIDNGPPEKVERDPNTVENHLYAILRRLESVSETACFQEEQLNSSV